MNQEKSYAALDLASYVASAVVADGQHLLLVSEDSAETLEGQIYSQVARGISESGGWEEARNELLANYSQQELDAAIGVLAQHGALRWSTNANSAGEQAFWESMSLEGCNQ